MTMTLTINGVEYAPVTDTTPSDWAVVCADGRWNIVGHIHRHDDGSVTLTDAQVIIYWGTTDGLGQLAIEGPTEKTKLGTRQTIRVAAHAVQLIMDTRAELWD